MTIRSPRLEAHQRLPALRVVFLVPWLLMTGALHAASLSQPLTLEAALTMVSDMHPDLLLAHSELDAAAARSEDARSRYGTEVLLSARARAVDPSPLAGRFGSDFGGHNDSEAELLIQRRLYDFGQTRARVAAAEAGTAGREHHLQEMRLRKRLMVMSRFLDVLLADSEVQLRDEAMVDSYVPYEKAVDRNRLGQASEIEVLENYSHYLEQRRVRNYAQAEQRNSRSRLALELNRPGELPQALIAPEFSHAVSAVPTQEALEDEALAGSPRLLALQAEVEAARAQLRVARSGGRPVLSGSLAAREYERQGSGDDDYVAELALVVPLSTGGKVAASAALARAELQQAEARLARAQLDVRQRIFELRQEIEVLHAQKAELEVLFEYRDLYMDRNRLLYEMEVESDFGDALVGYAEARLLKAQNIYGLARAWAELAVLTGNPDWDPLQTKASE